MTKRRSTKKVKKEDIHKQFKPNKSPKQVFTMGAFGGTYFRPIHSSVTGKDYTPSEAMRGLPKSWFEGVDLKTKITSSKYDKKVNKYDVKNHIFALMLHNHEYHCSETPLHLLKIHPNTNSSPIQPPIID